MPRRRLSNAAVEVGCAALARGLGYRAGAAWRDVAPARGDAGRRRRRASDRLAVRPVRMAARRRWTGCFMASPGNDEHIRNAKVGLGKERRSSNVRGQRVRRWTDARVDRCASFPYFSREARERASIMSQSTCPNCHGDGELTCPKCHKARHRDDIFDHMFGLFGRDCAVCGGSQKVECPLCNGRGTIYAYKGG
jgi:hypothetical protein